MTVEQSIIYDKNKAKHKKVVEEIMKIFHEEEFTYYEARGVLCEVKSELDIASQSNMV